MPRMNALCHFGLIQIRRRARIFILKSIRNSFRQISRHSHQKQLNFVRRSRSIALVSNLFHSVFVVCLFVFGFVRMKRLDDIFGVFNFSTRRTD